MNNESLRPAVLLAIFLAPNITHADNALYLGAASYHFNRDEDYRERHPLIGITVDGWTALAFRNSYDRDSVFVGYQWDLIELGAVTCGAKAGLVSGYDGHMQDWVPMIGGRLMPAAVPGCRWGWVETNLEYKSVSVGFRFNF